MRLATVSFDDSTSAALVTDDGRVCPVRALPGRADATDLAALIADPLREQECRALAPLARSARAEDWHAPILHPQKNMICVGKNYREHVAEGARAEGLDRVELPTAPVYFSKPHTSFAGHNQPIVHDPEFTSALDYEGELGVVVGRRARKVSAADALDHVFGYTIVNDVTARDVQQRHLQWFKGKSADGYAPIGPVVVTADEVPDCQELEIRTTVNGSVRQQDNTRNMIFDVATLLADLSQGMTLEPGDILATGTPQGVAWGMSTPAYLVPGDVVEVFVDGIGTLTNPVVTADPSAQAHGTQP